MNTPRYFTYYDKNMERSPEKASSIECTLCPNRCTIPPGKEGRCRVRANHGGKGALPYYGYISSLALDPIEKKPLYHFRPGTELLSVGFTGCNLHCPFCQNWHISQSTDVSGRFMTSGELVAAANDSKSRRTMPSIAAIQSIAYTYSEPLVHIEFLLDCMREARRAGIANVLVTNGCINPDAAKEVLAETDAANIDLKCFSGETYRNILGGDLKTVLDFIRMALEMDVHVELTTLIVPGLNDGRSEIDACCSFIAEAESAGNAVPWHLSAYHPSFKWKTPATDPLFLLETAERARGKLDFVYTGNITVPEGGKRNNDTPCLCCGETLISRRGYNTDSSGLLLREECGKFTYFCRHCGRKAPVKC